jgi:membrane associated rhomboid family serine protease
VLFSITLALALHDWKLIYRNLWFVIGAAALAEGIWQYVRSRRYTQDDAANDAASVRFTVWLKQQKLSGYTATLLGCIVIVAIVQSFTDDPIKAAGLVKPAVWQGQIWRLFTATLMHANLTHFWMNSVVLLHFARLVEHTVQRACVPLVFLLTSAVGSIFSVLLYPNSTSVGASGGLMGLMGFITIAAYFDKTAYPHTYFRQLIEAIVSVGVFGLFGFAFIDNAAHFGGLFGGLLLGWLLLRRKAPGALGREKSFTFGGVAALIVLCFVAAFAVWRILA